MTSVSSTGGSSGLSDYFSSKINNLFSKVDTDSSGSISLSEFEAVGKNVPGGASQAGKTGSVSQSSDAASQFKQIDVNGDGQLSKDEVTSYVQQQLNQRQTALTNIQELFGGGGSSKAHGHGGHHHKNSSDSSDQNADGSTSTSSTDPLSALLAALNGASGSSSTGDGTSSDNSDDPLSALFSAIDSNGDGSVSKDELTSFAQQQKAALESASSSLQSLFAGSSQSAGNTPPPPPPQDDNSISAVNGGSSASSSSTANAYDPLQALYSALDGNSDGSISKAELASYLSRYQQNAAAA